MHESMCSRRAIVAMCVVRFHECMVRSVPTILLVVAVGCSASEFVVPELGDEVTVNDTDCDRDGVIEVGGVVGDVPRYASQLEAVESYLAGSQFEEAQLFESGRYVVVVDDSRIVGIVTTDTDGDLYGVRETLFCG